MCQSIPKYTFYLQFIILMMPLHWVLENEFVMKIAFSIILIMETKWTSKWLHGWQQFSVTIRKCDKRTHKKVIESFQNHSDFPDKSLFLSNKTHTGALCIGMTICMLSVTYLADTTQFSWDWLATSNESINDRVLIFFHSRRFRILSTYLNLMHRRPLLS